MHVRSHGWDARLHGRCPDRRQLTDIRPLGESDGAAFCRALPARAGVVAIPNAVFYDHTEAGAPYVRFAFYKRTDVPTEAAERLPKAFAG